MQVISAPDGWPLWVSAACPGREHDTIGPSTHGLVDFRHPDKKPQSRELSVEHQTFNKVIPGIHGVAEQANALLKLERGRTT